MGNAKSGEDIPTTYELSSAKNVAHDYNDSDLS